MHLVIARVRTEDGTDTAPGTLLRITGGRVAGRS